MGGNIVGYILLFDQLDRPVVIVATEIVAQLLSADFCDASCVMNQTVCDILIFITHNVTSKLVKEPAN